MSSWWNRAFETGLVVAVILPASLGTAWAQGEPTQFSSSGDWRLVADPRTAVLAVLGSVAVLGVARKGFHHLRARKAVERLADPGVTVVEIESVADHGREGLMELFRILGTHGDPQKRHAAGQALATIWAQDQLVVEEEKAVVSRGYAVIWKARRRYPREMTRPIPISVEFGVPFLRDSGQGIRPENLEWSYRILGSERASLESYSDWLPGPCRTRFLVEPADFPGRGPFKLVLHAKVRTKGLTSEWEMELPHVSFAFEFDPSLSLDAILTMPDDHRALQLAQAVRLEDPVSCATAQEASLSHFLVLDEQFALRTPAEVVVRAPLPCDLAHELLVEFEGVEACFSAGSVVVNSASFEAAGGECRITIGPFQNVPSGHIDRPGMRGMRVVLRAEPQCGWADPDTRSLWPGTIATGWHTARIIRR